MTNLSQKRENTKCTRQIEERASQKFCKCGDKAFNNICQSNRNQAASIQQRPKKQAQKHNPSLVSQEEKELESLVKSGYSG